MVKLRLWGSVSFIVGSTGVGWTISEFGHESILMVNHCCGGLIIWFKPDETQLRNSDPTSNTTIKEKVGIFYYCLKQPKVIYFLLSHGDSYKGATVPIMHLVLYIGSSMGISEFNIALLWGIGVLAEVLLMRFNDQVVSSLGALKNMCLA